MQYLDLSPLPCAVSPEFPRPSSAAGLGFVDDSVVLALLTGTVGTSFLQHTETLALDEMDYAGWQPSVLAGARFACRA